MREVAGVPRVPPGAIPRPRLLALLDLGGPLTVLRGAGLGKTTLLAQWVTRLSADQTPVWLTLDPTVQTRPGLWVRVLGALHRAGVADDATLYRESAAIADDGDRAAAAIGRVLHGVGAVVLVLDDFGGSQPFWDQVCEDLVWLLSGHGSLRCVVAGPTRTRLEDGAPGPDVQVIDTDLLTLSPAEADALAAVAGLADVDAARSLAEVTGSVADVRYALDLHERTGTPLRNAAAIARRTSAPAGGAGLDLAARLHDRALVDLVGALALAPYVDLRLAAELSGRADAGTLLRRLAHDEVGHWSGEDGSVFRLSEHIRNAATAHLLAEHAERVPGLLARIARWLARDRQDAAGAVEYALRAQDLDLAERVMMWAYPLAAEDQQHLGEVLESTMAAGPPTARPFLTLTYGLYLHADPARRSRALEYLEAAAETARGRTARASASDRVVIHGLQTVAYRLLGRHRRMVETARWVLRGLPEARSERIDPVRGQTLAVAVAQAATSLLAAEDLPAAGAAFDDLAHLAAQVGWSHFGNSAASGAAMVSVLQGRMGAARAALQRVRPDAWPQPWHRGHAGALRTFAQAWVHLDDGDPQAALAELAILEPREQTIEYWDVLGGARAMARAMLGEPAAAALQLSQLRRQRETGSTLPALQVRLAVVQGILELAQGRAVDPPGAGGASRRALRAIAAAARGERERALTQLAGAESSAATPVQEAFTIIGGVVLAHRTAEGLSLPSKARRLAAVVSGHDLHWPLVLLTERDRERVLGALADRGDASARAELGASFAAVPALVPEALWQGGQVPALTPRERAVLAALAATGRRTEIAARLFVSVNTVKAQLRSLYAKLGVRTREAALTRALNLGLLQGSTRHS